MWKILFLLKGESRQLSPSRRKKQILVFNFWFKCIYDCEDGDPSLNIKSPEETMTDDLNVHI